MGGAAQGSSNTPRAIVEHWEVAGAHGGEYTCVAIHPRTSWPEVCGAEARFTRALQSGEDTDTEPLPYGNISIRWLRCRNDVVDFSKYSLSLLTDALGLRAAICTRFLPSALIRASSLPALT